MICSMCRERPRDRSGYCPECRKVYMRDYKARNRERLNAAESARRRDARATNPAWREARNAARRVARAADPERTREERRRYVEANADRVLELRRVARARRDQSKRTSYQATRKARQRGALVEHVDRRQVLREHGGICGICHEPVDPERFDVDHVVPLARGGEHSYANTQPAHPVCNQRKGATVPT